MVLRGNGKDVYREIWFPLLSSVANPPLYHVNTYQPITKMEDSKDMLKSKSDQEKWKMPSLRKPSDGKSSWSETSTASSSSSRRSSGSRSDNRKGDTSERRRRNSPPGSDREDLDDCFTFDLPGSASSRRRTSVPGMFDPPNPTSSRRRNSVSSIFDTPDPTSSRRRNSVPSMFDTPNPTSSRRRNSVPSAGSSNSRSQRSEFESKLSNLFSNSNHFATSSSLLFQCRFLNCTVFNG